MKDLFRREGLYRGADALEKIGRIRLVMCGAGAVGSTLVNNLMRQGLRNITVIDSDRVEVHNVGTQTYEEGDVGAFKVDVLQAQMFRTVGVEIRTLRQRLTARNVANLFKEADIAIDGFDNHDSRAVVAEHCRRIGIPCLHVGLSEGYAEVSWNDNYRVPQDVIQDGSDVCDYAMSRNLIQFAVALASEAVIRFIVEGENKSYSFTLKDLRINVEGT